MHLSKLRPESAASATRGIVGLKNGKCSRSAGTNRLLMLAYAWTQNNSNEITAAGAATVFSDERLLESEIVHPCWASTLVQQEE